MAKGIKQVGEDFAAQVVFLPELVIAADVMKAGLAVLDEEIKKSGDKRESLARVVIGTIKGDIHDIGKSVVAAIFQANGYDVLDLGVDVPPEVFVEKMKEYDPHIIALSGFLTLAFDAMKETIAKMKEAGLKDTVKIMIGGGTIDERIVDYVGADAYGDTAMDAVTLADKWMGGAQ